MNIKAGKTNSGAMYAYGTIGNHMTRAQIHQILRGLYPLICEEYRSSDLTFEVGDYRLQMSSVQIPQAKAENLFRKIHGKKFRSTADIAYWFEKQIGQAVPTLVIGESTGNEILDSHEDIDLYKQIYQYQEYIEEEKYLPCSFGMHVIPGFYDSGFLLQYELINDEYLIINADWR